MRRLADVVQIPASGGAALPTVVTGPTVLPAIIEQARTSQEMERSIMRALPAEVRAGLRDRIDFQTFEFIGFELVKPIRPVIAREVVGWLDAVGHLPTRSDVIKEVSRCLSVTAARAKDHADLKAMIVVLAEELAEFPAVAVQESLREWARTEKWWPTLSEIRGLCLKATRMQRSLRSVLEIAISRGDGA